MNPAEPPRRARIVFAVLDLISAVAVFGTMKVLWSASLFWPIALGLWGALLVASSIGLLSGTRTGRFFARLAAVYQLGFLLVLVVGILSSVAYLSGIYGQVGVAVVLLLILALLLELIGLLPIFKLRSIGVLENDQAWLHRTWPFAVVALLVGVAFHCVSVHASASLRPWVPISKDGRVAMARYLWATAIGEATSSPTTNGYQPLWMAIVTAIEFVFQLDKTWFLTAVVLVAYTIVGGSAIYSHVWFEKPVAIALTLGLLSSYVLYTGVWRWGMETVLMAPVLPWFLLISRKNDQKTRSWLTSLLLV